MNNRRVVRRRIAAAGSGVMILILCGWLAADPRVRTGFGAFPVQVADLEFDTKVATPAFRDQSPSVLLDEAHFNIHTADGTYKPFVNLLTSDGCTVHRNRHPFSSGVLECHDVLVIAGALGARRMKDPDAAKSAFTRDEQVAVVEWVRGGGRLLITADHPPLGTAVADLLNRFGIECSGGYTIDTSPERRLPRSLSALVFSRQDGLLGDSPVTDGSSPSERITRIVTSTGNSFRAPPEGWAFLHVSPTGWEVFSRGAIRTLDHFISPPEGLMARPPVSAAGRSQGVAVRYGEGRVVAVGDGALLTAMRYGWRREPKGMNIPGSDARQLALNILHWLSGLLEPEDESGLPQCRDKMLVPHP